jgi:hypothetical protein
VGNGSAAQKGAVSSTDEQLPPTKRWTARRKAEVLAAVRSGKITMEETMRRYQLTEEEFLVWQRAFETRGLAGLKATRLQEYREARVAKSQC